MKRIVFVFLIFTCVSSVFGNTQHPLTEGKEYKYPNTYSYPILDPSVYFEGEFLWFKPYAFVPYALVQRNITYGMGGGSITISKDEQIRNVRPSFHPGFRIAVGLHLPVNVWRLHWEYTHLITTDTQTTKPAAGESLSPIWETVPIFSAEPDNSPIARARQHINFNVFDWGFTNYLIYNDQMVLIPVYGLRGAWIKDEVNVVYSGLNTSGLVFPVFDDVRLKNDFRGFGLIAGLKTHWLLAKNIEIFGSTVVSSMISRLSLIEKEIFHLVTPSNELVAGDIANGNRFVTLKHAIELRLGASWGFQFGLHKDKYLGFSAKYEMQLWPNLIALPRYNPTITQTELSNPIDFYRTSFALQGFSFRAKFSF